MTSKRQEIIEAAAGLMESNGYENTKLSDILEASGAGKGQFYYYFSSKRDLGLAVIDYFFAAFKRELLGGILGSKGDPETRLNEMLEWIISFHQSRQAKCGCVFGNLALEMSEHDEEFRQKVNEVFKVWADRLGSVLEEMLEISGSANPIEAGQLAQTIVAMIEGGILLMKNNQDIEILRDMIKWIRYLVGTYASENAIPLK
ncbi:TetR/AcrR family transcriptional regulator [Desulfosporosinus sp. SB140]|uniref:TetR/AcrR family transcriptional regulator n=1 Tax=Desulfosporosinus paludis TaxID=3115649 RepID=UPI00388EF0F1